MRRIDDVANALDDGRVTRRAFVARTLPDTLTWSLELADASAAPSPNAVGGLHELLMELDPSGRDGKPRR